MSLLIYMFIFMFGNMVMRGVIEEKSGRIVEVIVSSVKSVELMIGKILGIALVALTQFLIWVVLTLVLVAVAGFLMGGDIVGTMETADVAGMGSILKGISEIRFGYILTCFLIYFVLGYLLYAGMFAAVGAAVDNEADTGQLSMPVTIPLIIGLFLMLPTFQNPTGQLISGLPSYFHLSYGDDGAHSFRCGALLGACSLYTSATGNFPSYGRDFG